MGEDTRHDKWCKLHPANITDGRIWRLKIALESLYMKLVDNGVINEAEASVGLGLLIEPGPKDIAWAENLLRKIKEDQ